MDYSDLENLQLIYFEQRKTYYKMRYQYMQKINQIKKASPLYPQIDYAKFSGQVRSDIRKKMRRNLFGKPPRNFQLDHKVPILYFYFTGETNLQVINDPSNLEWVPKKYNLEKGVIRDEVFANLPAHTEHAILPSNSPDIRG